LGPVLFCALARLAAICFSLAIEVLLLLGGIVPVAVVPAGSTLRLLEQHAAATQRYRQLSIRRSPRSVMRLVEEIRAVC
jgi:hypothetical protein